MGNGRDAHKVLINSSRCRPISFTGGWQCWSCKMPLLVQKSLLCVLLLKL